MRVLGGYLLERTQSLLGEVYERNLEQLLAEDRNGISIYNICNASRQGLHEIGKAATGQEHDLRTLLLGHE
ncbi:hypothetical protein Trco_002185 [Trichoderma cornu-damae]|uniref:Uncharacterized protein n=1 Tax=Trichoderma cornu-damae TaxID=654480 RepID=A0A9P8TXL0_9HYPO|nr:hypothetical protein Trco_002185 [Trichoderma cornu-damae]